ncbi:hypothetical protein ABW21_db0203858 [Orbilia brochopaga]|nr:hypothetical protein ABW21_db0203858 [Drechslerella brochopaga]
MEGSKAEWADELIGLEAKVDRDADDGRRLVWLRFAVPTSTEVAYELQQVRDVLLDMILSLSAQAKPLPAKTNFTQIKDFCEELLAKWADITNHWESAAMTLLEASVHYRYALLEITKRDVHKLKVHRQAIETIIARSPEHQQKKILAVSHRTFEAVDNLLRVFENFFRSIDGFEEFRRVRLESFVKRDDGLRRRRKDTPGPEIPEDTVHSSSPPPARIGNTKIAGNLSFPSFFYPSPAAFSLWQKIIKSRDTIWFPVFILTVASSIFTGMAFFSPDNSLFSTLSQMLRSYASLWCLLIPLFRDQTLPVWPTRGWLYGSVATSASLGVVGVVFCTVDGRWSGLISSIGDFSGLAATVLLAMGVVNSAAAHAHVP